MEIVQFIPGVIVSPNAVTLPTGAPDIEAVVEVVVPEFNPPLVLMLELALTLLMLLLVHQ